MWTQKDDDRVDPKGTRTGNVLISSSREKGRLHPGMFIHGTVITCRLFYRVHFEDNDASGETRVCQLRPD